MTEQAQRGRVVVIGAGIIGSAIARELAVRGHAVTVVDPAPAEGASAGNAGLVVPGYAAPLATLTNLIEGATGLVRRSSAIELGVPLSADTAVWLLRFAWAARPSAVRVGTRHLFELASRSVELYQELAATLPGLEFAKSGWLWTCESPASINGVRRTAARLRSLGSRAEVLDAHEARRREPGLGNPVLGGLWLPDEYTVDPSATTRLLLADAVARGAEVLRDRVTSVSVNGRGVDTIELAMGELRPRQVVIATGAEAANTGRMFGLRLPVAPGYGWSLTLADPQSPARGALMSVDDHVVISRRRGIVRVTGGMRIGGRAFTSPPRDQVDAMRSIAERILPEVAALDEVERWAGARPMTPNSLPLVGTSRRMPAVHYAVGHGTLGVTLAPATAHIVADRIGA